MLKALCSLIMAAIAALTIASPAAAAPVCADVAETAPASSPPGEWYVRSLDYCDGYYEVVSVDWTGSYATIMSNGTDVLLEGLYYSTETAVITVTDGLGTDTFTLELTPCYVSTYPYC